MKVEELRIGNKIGFYKPLINELQIGTIQGILFDDDEGILVFIPEFSKKTWLNIEAIKPLKLNKEWIIKFGFKQTEDGINKFGRGFWSNGTSSIYHYDGYTSIKEVWINYVHKFQNIYFEIEGTILQVQD